MQQDIVILNDIASIGRDMADRFVKLAAEAISSRGRLSFCLSGGSTPKSLYTLLASDAYRKQVDWSKVHCFFGDERSVAPDHPDSNYQMARETLLSHVSVPPANVHRMPAEEADLPAAARRYEDELRTFFGNDGFPVFDVMLLGMGPDGHTASLFPGSAALGERERWVVPNWVEKMKTWRMTLTYPVLNASRHVFFLVGGADKAEVLKTVLESSGGAPQYPSSGIQPVNGRLVWLVERSAATALTPART